MTKAKSTKKALLMSALSLLLCFSMLIGTTFAWFTDSVTSANNIIKSGNLDVELEYAVFNADGSFKEWKDVNGASDILTNTLFEPGVTEVAYLRVANEGSLALKYQLGINIKPDEKEGVNVNGDPFKLSDYIQFGVIENVNGEKGAYAKREDAVAAVTNAQKISAGYTDASSMEPDEELYLALVVYMPTTVGNEANHNGIDVPEINLGINIYATQFTYESDSFGTDYDENAWHEKFQIFASEDLVAALANGEENVVLMEDITASEAIEITEDVKINLNGKKLTANLTVSKDADVVISKGEIVTANGDNSAIETVGNLTLDDVMVDSARHGVRVEGGKTVINGGTYVAGGTAGRTQHALNVSDGGEVIINGGTFIGPRGTASDSGSAVKVQSGSKVTINGGSFSGGKNNTLSSAGTLVVNGGLFDQDPSAYVAANRTVEDNGNGTWTVTTTKSDLKNQISSSVQDAIANGETEVEVDAHGANIGNLNYGLNTSLVPAGTTVTIKNAVTSGESYGNAVAGTVVFEDCVFDNPNGAYSIHFDAGNGNVIFKNCVLTGWCSYGSAIKSVEMYGCTIKHNGIYGQQRFYQPAVLEDCVIESTVTVDAGSNCELVVKNCTVDNGAFITDVIYVDDCFTGITIDGKKTVYTQAAFNAAEKAGKTVYLIGNDTGIVYDLKNNQADELTVIGLGDDVKLVNNTKYASGKTIGAIWQKINLENVTITNTVYTMADGGKSTFTNVNFAAGFRQGYGKEVKFVGCTFGSNSEGYALHFQTDSASEGGQITLTQCEFEGGKVHLGGKRAYVFTNCDFAAGTDFQAWSNVTLDGCTVDGVAVTSANAPALFPKLDLTKVTIR